jgi:DNA-binding beta-propeller fold protein YncE
MLMVRRFVAVLAGVLGVGCAVMALEASSAFAAFTYPFDGQLAPASGSFGELEAGSVAVDDENGDTYVADSKVGVVDVFETATGKELASLDSKLTPAGSFGEGQGLVAVAANDGTGDVYVLDSKDGVVDVFEASGGYVGEITGAATPAKGFNHPGGIAVAQATGDVYVVDAENGVVDIFSAAGVYTGRQISLALIPEGFTASLTRGIAVDDFNGDVYVSDSGAVVVYVFDAAGEYLTTWTGSNTPAGSFGSAYLSVAADNATGDVYVTETKHDITDVFEPSGEYLTQFGHSYNNPLGTAVDQARGKVYVSNTGAGVVDIFGPVLVIPDVATGSATEVRATSATLNGTVNPEGIKLSYCRFEYGSETSYGQSAPCVPAAGSIPADSNEHAVSAHIVGLAPGSVYHFRLVAANANDASEPNAGADATLETLPPPSIGSVASVNVASASADLTAQIDPNGYDTTYRFEWGTSTSYGTSTPIPDADIGAGTTGVLVTAHLSGLSANTTYHWRVVASNENGTTATGDQTFVYDTAGGGLPDDRAYEMVTPPQKNGARIGAGFLLVSPSIAEDGSRVIVNSIQCFAGAGSCTGNRETEGEPVALTRTSGGWVASSMAPPATQFDRNTFWFDSADADTALFSIPTPPLGEDDLYARQPDGSFFDVGPLTPSAAGALGIAFEIGAATADLSHVVYMISDAGAKWPFDPSSATPSLYEYVGAGNTAPELVGVSGGPGSTDLIGCITQLGGYGRLYGAMSADGGAVFFTTEGCGLLETVYARIDGSRTVSVSGRSPAECTSPGCLGSSPANAKYMGASEDGSVVFFKDSQRLTDDAGEGSSNLYEYDFSRPAGHNLVAVSAGGPGSAEPGVQGVLAVSPDGSHVYFVAHGVLSGAANSQGQTAVKGGENLYVYERDASHPEGRVSFIATLASSDYSAEAAPGVADVTPDGRFLVFTSAARLTADDASTTGAEQVFRYDALTGDLVRISIGEDGFDDNGNAGVANASIVEAVPGGHAGYPRADPTMSNDGAFVFFESPVGLTPQALNEVPDEAGGLAENVYEWHEGQVYLISDGKDLSDIDSHSSVSLLGSDGTGANVFFTTVDRLVPEDTDTQMDVYDARICTAGEPCVAASQPPASCQGEACHGVPGGAPSLLAPASASFSGAGNLVPQTVPVVKAKKKARAKPKKPPRTRKAKRRRTARGKRRSAEAGRAIVRVERGRR